MKIIKINFLLKIAPFNLSIVLVRVGILFITPDIYYNIRMRKNFFNEYKDKKNNNIICICVTIKER